MSNRRTIRVAAAALAVMMSTVVCELSASEVLDEPIRIQRTATREAQQTETTVAATKTTLVITPTITPTATLTVVPVSLPAIFIISDPSDDANFCGEHSQADDPAVDILSVAIYAPASSGSDHNGWMTQVELGVPANITFANDHILTVKAIIQVEGETENTYMLIETNANNIKMGVCSNMSCQIMLPGTGHLTFIDDEGKTWFLIPLNSVFVTITTAHFSEIGQPTLCDNIDVPINSLLP